MRKYHWKKTPDLNQVYIIKWFLKGLGSFGHLTIFSEVIPNFANAEHVRSCSSVIISPFYRAVALQGLTKEILLSTFQCVSSGFNVLPFCFYQAHVAPGCLVATKQRRRGSVLLCQWISFNTGYLGQGLEESIVAFFTLDLGK